MTPEELDEWIVKKTDTHVIYEMMNERTDAMLGVHHYSRLLKEETGTNEFSCFFAVRNSLMRLLKAKRIFAVGINGWTTNNTNMRVTPSRIREVEMVVCGTLSYTSDLAIGKDELT